MFSSIIREELPLFYNRITLFEKLVSFPYFYGESNVDVTVEILTKRLYYGSTNLQAGPK